MGRTARKWRWDFRGHNLILATASNAGTPWSKADTSAAGAPTLVGLNGGGIRLLLDNTNEVQNLCLYQGDVLPFDIDDIIRASFVVACAAALNAAESLAFGLASARNDVIDSIAAAAIFRCIGNQSVLVESDDGTNDNDDVATGLTLGATWKRFDIDFASRNTTREAPSLSLGRKSNVEFYGYNGFNSRRRVASGTRFDMSNYSSGLQCFFQLQKTAATSTGNLDILAVEIDYSEPA